MKILVISDMHANLQSLEAILRQENWFDILCCAGDFVDYGISPNEVIELISACAGEKYLVRGNHDDLLVDFVGRGDPVPTNPKQFKWLHDNAIKLNEFCYRFLRELPETAWFECDGWSYLVKHQYDSSYGFPTNTDDFDWFWETYAPIEHRYDVKRRIVFGHSHRQSYERFFGNRECVFPGSTSYRRPDETDKTAHYAVIDGQSVFLRRVPYDRSRSFAASETYRRNNGMMTTELQDFNFFFGNAATTREPLEQLG